MSILDRFKKETKKESKFPIPDDLLEKIEEFRRISEGSSEEVNTMIGRLSKVGEDMADFPKALSTAVSFMSSRWFSSRTPWLLTKLTMEELLALLTTLEYHVYLGRLAQRVLEEEENE